MNTSTTISPVELASFACACPQQVRTACTGESFYKEINGKKYCVLHYPGEDKYDDFKQAFQRKLEAKKFDFRGIWFPSDTVFRNFHFTSSVNFREAVFTSKVDFSYAEFYGKVDFRHAVFHGDALFHVTHFKSDVSFRLVRFNSKADFSSAMFDNYVRFIGEPHHRTFSPRASLNFRYVRIEKPERVFFHSLNLRPGWFINVDVRKFGIADIVWRHHPKKEVEVLKDVAGIDPYAVLSATYRQLAVNAEENHSYRDAAMFRFYSLEVPRWQKRYKDGLKHYDRRLVWRMLKRRMRHCRSHPLLGSRIALYDFVRRSKRELQNRNHKAVLSLTWWYWVSSGYGEKAERAAVGLFMIIILFALIYFLIGFPPPEPDQQASVLGYIHRAVHSFIYSVEVSSLQKPDPRPTAHQFAATFFVGLETILGPLQVALLALAIRRKFMR